MRALPFLSVFPFLGLLVSGLSSCGGSGPSPQEACKQAMAAVCERAHSCGGTAWSNMGSSSVAECTTEMQALNCSDPADYACDPGETFQEAQVPKCIDALKIQACTDLANMPTACDLVCRAGGGIIGGGGTGGAGGAGGSGGAGGGSSTTSGSSARDACNQTMAIMCERTSACFGSAGLSELGYGSVAACTTGMQTDCATLPASGCDSGQTYYPDQAPKCIAELKSISCTDFTEGNLPTACDLMCR